MFGAGRELDRATLFAATAVWWNGLPLTWHAHNVLFNNFAMEPAHPLG